MRQQTLPQLLQAEQDFRHSISQNPRNAEAKLSLTEILTWLDQLDEARQLCDEVLEVVGYDQDALLQRVYIEIQRGGFEIALNDLGVLQKVDPHNSLFQRLKAMCFFQMERIPEGWEQATQAFNFEFLKIRYPDLPRWQGEDVTDTVLVLTMLDIRGGGDEIMFASILPEIIKKAKLCFIETEIRALELYRQSFPDAVVFCRGEQPWVEQAVKVDYHSWVRELAPHFFSYREEFPQERGYLKVTDKSLAHWTSELNALDEKTLKVGICWRSFHSVGPNKPFCLDLLDLGAVFKLKNVTFINLHTLDGEEEVLSTEKEFGIKIHSIDEDGLHNNFDHIAGLSMACDAVVTASTTVSMIASGVGANVFELRSDYTALCMDVLPWFAHQKIYSRPWNRGWAESVRSLAEDLDAFLLKN